MHLNEDMTSTQLNQSHVQRLNTMFANSKKLECFKSKEKIQTDSRHRWAASAAINDETSHEDPVAIWSELSASETRRRLCVASEYMRDKALPFLRRCLNALGDDGEPLSENAITA